METIFTDLYADKVIALVENFINAHGITPTNDQLNELIVDEEVRQKEEFCKLLKDEAL